MLVHEQIITTLNAGQAVHVELTPRGHQLLAESLMSSTGAPYASVIEHIDANYNIGGSTLRFELLKFMELFGPLVGPTSFDPDSEDCLFKSAQLVSMTYARPPSAITWQDVNKGDIILSYIPGDNSSRRVLEILEKPDINSREEIIVKYRDVNNPKGEEAKEACELGLHPNSRAEYTRVALYYD